MEFGSKWKNHSLCGLFFAAMGVASCNLAKTERINTVLNNDSETFFEKEFVVTICATTSGNPGTISFTLRNSATQNEIASSQFDSISISPCHDNAGGDIEENSDGFACKPISEISECRIVKIDRRKLSETIFEFKYSKSEDVDAFKYSPQKSDIGLDIEGILSFNPNKKTEGKIQRQFLMKRIKNRNRFISIEQEPNGQLNENKICVNYRIENRSSSVIWGTVDNFDHGQNVLGSQYLYKIGENWLHPSSYINQQAVIRDETDSIGNSFVTLQPGQSGIAAKCISLKRLSDAINANPEAVLFYVDYVLEDIEALEEDSYSKAITRKQGFMMTSYDVYRIFGKSVYVEENEGDATRLFD
ncbi:MAG: hypothetical protein JW709_13400 [Sedimentisphaerales bacterium]|nr:hypothetical protein [Sedimentisphaerales bacterium]MBN2674052.1 hypothetical protein [Deltaproteobacteria bacterium]